MAARHELTPQERSAAVAKAVASRRIRAEVKRKIKTRQMTLPEVFVMAETEAAVASMRVITLLESLPALGKIKAKRLLDQIGIAESRRVKGLGPKQRAELLRVSIR
jgi:hypothetical protein